MGRSYFGAIERGEFNVSLDTIFKIAGTLDTTAAPCLPRRACDVPSLPGDRSEARCGPFAVPSAENSREQARTADHEPQRFRGYSRMFPAVPSFGVYRGDRI